MTESVESTAAISDRMRVRAIEVAEVLNPHDRALVGLLAVIHLQRLEGKDAGIVLEGLAFESTRMSRVLLSELAGFLSSKLGISEAIEKVPRVLPVSAVLAIKLAHSEGHLDEFFKAFQVHVRDQVDAPTSHSDTLFARGLRLFGLVAVFIWLISFICLFVVPEHMKMLEEFGVDYSLELKTFTMVAETIVTLWFIPTLAFVVLIAFAFYWRPQVFLSYLRRWKLGSWQQVVLPRALRNRRWLSWFVDTPSQISEDVNRFVRAKKMAKVLGQPEEKFGPGLVGHDRWQKLATRRTISRRESIALNLTNSAQTQAWVLRKSVSRIQRRLDKNSLIYANVIFAIVRVTIAIMVIMAAFAMFSTLISIIEEFANV